MDRPTVWNREGLRSPRVPWLNAQALNVEVTDCIEKALRRGVIVRIAWGIGDAPDAAIPGGLQGLQDRFGKRKLQIKFRGNTHRKILLWDGRSYIMGSFNWGSFRGDPRMKVRHEAGTLTSNPALVQNLVEEFKKVFEVEELGGA